MDPLTGIALASTAYKAICSAFQHGRDIEQMAGDLGRWMQGINAVKEGHSKAKGRRIGSVEEEALETFAAMKKAEQIALYAVLASAIPVIGSIHYGVSSASSAAAAAAAVISACSAS